MRISLQVLCRDIHKSQEWWGLDHKLQHLSINVTAKPMPWLLQKENDQTGEILCVRIYLLSLLLERSTTDKFKSTDFFDFKETLGLSEQIFRGYFSTLTSRVLPWNEWTRWRRRGFMSALGLDTPLGEKDSSQNGTMKFTAPAEQSIHLCSSFRAWGLFPEVISSTRREQKYPEYSLATGSLFPPSVWFCSSNLFVPSKVCQKLYWLPFYFLQLFYLSEWYLSKMTKMKLIDF